MVTRPAEVFDWASVAKGARAVLPAPAPADPARAPRRSGNGRARRRPDGDGRSTELERQLARLEERNSRLEDELVTGLARLSEQLAALTGVVDRLTNEEGAGADAVGRARPLHEVLAAVPSIGPARQAVLLAAFATCDALAGSPVEQVASLPGIGPRLAYRARAAAAAASPRGR